MVGRDFPSQPSKRASHTPLERPADGPGSLSCMRYTTWI